MSLFPTMPEKRAETPAALQPLAERMRPRTLDEFMGQEKLLGPGKPLRVQIESDNLSSMLFWGPPGCGKTTLARVIARLTKSEFVAFSAVLSGIKEIKEVMAEAEKRSQRGYRTIVFVDEVHRFNKAQQDAFLPHVEAGHILFIGATTENPSFEVISPLLSRTKVYVLESLTTPQIVELLGRALEDKERGLGNERIQIGGEERAEQRGPGGGADSEEVRTGEETPGQTPKGLKPKTEEAEISGLKFGRPGEKPKSLPVADSAKEGAHETELQGKYQGSQADVSPPQDLLWKIAAFANGDARTAYNTLELCVRSAKPETTDRSAGIKASTELKTEQRGKNRPFEGHAEQDAGTTSAKGVKRITAQLLEDVLQRKMLRYDKAGEEHYNLISALHKSVRNSDPDAALYWLARMVESGEDPLYLARRMVRMASEDIGLAEPGALAVTLAAKEAFDFLGAPEGYLALAQAVVYLSLAPKSNSLYVGYGKVIEDVRKTEADPVPLHLRNAVTGLMKSIGYGEGYKYAHNFTEKVTDMMCLPENLSGRVYYQPGEQGFEARLRARMEEIRKSKMARAT
jgi:putative ATPase